MAKKMIISADDVELFRQTVGPVKPICQDKVVCNTPKPKPFPEQSIKNNLLVKEDMLSSLLDPTDYETGDELYFIRPGIQKNIFRKLRKGQFTIEREFDLHGMTVDVARKSLSCFFENCRVRNNRCIKIIHGKGRGSKGKQPVLKIKLNQWLQQRDEVLAFCSARPVDGGTGAVYVLLKKL